MVTTVVTAKKLIDGKSDSPFENMAVVMDGSRIVQIVPQSQLQLPEGIEVRTFDFPNSYISLRDEDNDRIVAKTLSCFLFENNNRK